MKDTIPELLAPAGNMEKMKVALAFGADAVYFGIPDFSLRARVNQFDRESIKEGTRLCRQMGKRCYVTLNIYAHNFQIKQLPAYVDFLREIAPDGLIISDSGILRMARKLAPELPVHISTQANVTNAEAVRFWKEQGASRVILARELALDEIREIKRAVPDIELECFVHGAMCMSYSGRCILSKWMTGRSANLGDCAQPCRWRYTIRGQRTESREQGIERPINGNLWGPVEVVDDFGKVEMRVEEDNHGTYMFNSYDMCLIEHLRELTEAGIDSFKIEGRAKSVYYVAMVVRAYRKVLDSLQRDDSRNEYHTILEKQLAELGKLAHRGYSKGFLMGVEPPHLFEKDSSRSQWMFCGISANEGIATDHQDRANQRLVTVHNFIHPGDNMEVLTPDETIPATITAISRGDTSLPSAHGGGDHPYTLTFDIPVPKVFLLRKKL